MSNDIASKLIDAAKSFTGLRYQLDPPPDAISTIDCSLLIIKAAEKAGIPFANGVRTAEQIRQVCIPVDWDDVTPGTLLFFEGTYDAGPVSADGHIASHVGISLGAGSRRMWDAHQRRGTPDAVGITDISTAYWQQHLLEARRPPQLAGATVTPPAYPLGIDVSNHQGGIDWQAVIGAGYQFAFVKASEGTSFRDPFFATNWQQARVAGLYVGAYHYARPTMNGPEDEAGFFVSVVQQAGIREGDLLALDLEEGLGYLGDWAYRFLTRVEALVGFKPLLYTSPAFITAHGVGQPAGIEEFGLWLASWGVPTPPQAPPPWDFVAFHQWSATERVPGISGDVDGDRFNGAADRIPLYGKPASSPSPPPTDPSAAIREQLAAIRAAADRIEAALT